MTGHDRFRLAPSAPGQAAVVCATCLWVGPRRDLADPHFTGLISDDRDWHTEVTTSDRHPR